MSKLPEQIEMLNEHQQTVVGLLSDIDAMKDGVVDKNKSRIKTISMNLVAVSKELNSMVLNEIINEESDSE